MHTCQNPPQQDSPESEVTKEQFKKYYFQYATPDSGWTADYWNKFYEHEQGKKYFFRRPETPECVSMTIVSDASQHRLVFLTEDAFDFPETSENTSTDT